MPESPASSRQHIGGSRGRPTNRSHAQARHLLLTLRVRTIFRPFEPPYPSLCPMSDSDAERLSRLRHDLSNPLSALLAEAQLLLLNESNMDAETLTALREIEALAIRMRTMLREL